MRLLACHIENFGRLHDFSMEFADGVNTISQPNGWGKSTLAAFFKVMFYGFDSKKAKDAPDKERKLYLPWQGGTYGGELDFEVNGRRYRISRTFGKTERTDQFHLYDLTTNLESSDYSDKIGEELFGLDSGSFRRSVFIAQSEVLSGSTDAINAKLGNLVENTNDINNYETAQSRIKETMNRLTPDRVSGSIRKNKNRITELSEVLRGSDAAEKAYLEKKQLLEEKQKEKERISKQRRIYAGRLRSASEADKKETLRQQYIKLEEEEQNKKELYLEKRKAFPQEIPQAEDLSSMQQKARQLEEYHTTGQNFAFTPEEERSYQKLKEQLAEGKQAVSTEPKENPRGLLSGGVVAVAAGIILLLMGMTIFRGNGILFAMCGGIAVVAGIVLLFHEKAQQRTYEEKKQQEQKLLFELKSSEQELQRLEQKKQQYEHAKEMEEKVRKRLTEFLMQYQIALEEDITGQLTALLIQSEAVKTAYGIWEDAVHAKEDFQKRNPQETRTPEEKSEESLEELNEKIAHLDEESEKLQDVISDYEGQIEELQEKMDLRDEKEAELDKLRKRQEKEQKRYELLKTTHEYLQAAKEQFTSRYMAPISNGFARYYNDLNASAGDQTWMVDANMELKLKEQGEYRDVRWLSAGYQDLIGFCMRLALVDAMFPETKPFLVLDDPFVNLDQEKAQKGNELLKQLGKEYQTIYFTCHNSRVP